MVVVKGQETSNEPNINNLPTRRKDAGQSHAGETDHVAGCDGARDEDGSRLLVPPQTSPNNVPWHGAQGHSRRRRRYTQDGSYANGNLDAQGCQGTLLTTGVYLFLGA